MSNRVLVLDQGWVEFQEKMGTDLDVVTAARVSLLGESKGEDKDKKLLKYLWKHGHHSPFEMAEMKFRIHAPEIVWRHILRHRTGNFNLQSGRYGDYPEGQFHLPTVWRLQSASNKQGSEGELDSTSGDVLTQQLQAHYEAGYRLYEQALAKNVAREQARLFLGGFGVYSMGIVKFDLRNLLHFLSLRTAPDAQWETQQYAVAMESFVEEYFPWTYEVVNPK